MPPLVTRARVKVTMTVITLHRQSEGGAGHHADYNLTIRCRWIRAIMRIKTDILGRYFEEPGAGIEDLSQLIPRLARLNNV